MDTIGRSPSPLPMDTSVSPAEDDSCPICRADFYGRDVVPDIVTPNKCNHCFDLGCITDWFHRLPLERRVCSLCQKPALPLRLVSGEADKGNPFIRHEALEAAYQGDAEALFSMLTSDPALALRSFHDPKFDCEKTLLHAAAQNGHINVVELLLTKGATVDAAQSDVGQRTAGHPCMPLPRTGISMSLSCC